MFFFLCFFFLISFISFFFCVFFFTIIYRRGRGGQRKGKESVIFRLCVCVCGFWEIDLCAVCCVLAGWRWLACLLLLTGWFGIDIGNGNGTGYWYWLLVLLIGYWLLVTGYGLLVTGYWLLVYSRLRVQEG